MELEEDFAEPEIIHNDGSEECVFSPTLFVLVDICTLRFILFMCMCVHLCECIPCVCSAQGDLKKDSGAGVTGSCECRNGSQVHGAVLSAP